VNYVGLHVHTHYSLMDGVATPQEYVDRAIQLGMPALAITDHGTLSGHREMYRAAKAAGIKPILGIEGYIAADRFDHRDKAERTTPLDLIYNHIVILAKNQQGLENLNKLNEIAWTEGFYKKPRIDFAVLEKYKDGLIVLSACLSGLIAKAIEVGEFAVAKQHIEWFKKTFNDDFYIEVMPHNPPEINLNLMQLADEFNVKIVVTPDCHHSDVDQKVIQEMMLILNTHAKLEKDVKYDKSKKYDDMMDRLDYLYGKDRMMSFNRFDIHLLSYDEMKSAMTKELKFREDMFANTLEIANKVEDYDIKEDLNLLPVQYKNPDKELQELAMKSLEDMRLTSSWIGNDQYEVRLVEELEIIKEKKFAPYFLVVMNMINWAKKEGIMVGPGRGSSAGSLLCYVLGITDIDPIKHGLLFSVLLILKEMIFQILIQISRILDGMKLRNT
jgi:DNA polymerase-3 subunit alpha